MKILVDQKELAAALAKLQPFIPKKPQHPVLANVLLNAADDQLHLSAFDLAQSLQLTVPCTVTEPGATTLPASLTTAIVAKCQAGPLTLAVTDNTATLSSASGEYEVRGISADEYPNLPECRAEAIALEATDLYRTIREVAFAVATDDSKMILNGIHLSLRDGILRAAATDGHRLAYTQHELDTTAELPPLTINPAPLRAFLKNTGGALQVQADPVEVAIAIDDSRLTVRPIDGTYPQYEKLIPERFAITAVVERQLLLQALERLAVFAAEGQNHVIRLGLADHQMDLQCDAAERGRAHESLALEALIGDDITVAFNVRYLADGLKALTGETVTFHLNSPTMPVVLSGDGANRYLLMPVQIRG